MPLKRKKCLLNRRQWQLVVRSSRETTERPYRSTTGHHTRARPRCPRRRASAGLSATRAGYVFITSSTEKGKASPGHCVQSLCFFVSVVENNKTIIITHSERLGSRFPPFLLLPLTCVAFIHIPDEAPVFHRLPPASWAFTGSQDPPLSVPRPRPQETRAFSELANAPRQGSFRNLFSGPVPSSTR